MRLVLLTERLRQLADLAVGGAEVVGECRVARASYPLVR